MKICIPTESDALLESSTCNHFGTAPYFTFVDTEAVDLRAVRNPACHSNRGACHHISLLAAHGVDAVVCDGIGRRAVAALREAGIDVFAAPDGTIADIVSAVGDGTARLLSANQTCAGGRQRQGASGECGRHDTSDAATLPEDDDISTA